MARALSPAPAHRSRVRQSDPALDGPASGRVVRGRSRPGRSRTHRPGPGCVDGAPGGVDDGARLRRGLRRSHVLELVGLGVCCAIFFAGLADPTRLLTLRTLDVLVLLSFTVSLFFFDRGEVFGAPARLSTARLSARAARPGSASAAARFDPALSWPVWLLAAVAVFLVGLRVGLNVEKPRSVIDVGYAGVIGGDRILDGEAPYGHMPVENRPSRAGRPIGRRDPRLDPGQRPLRVGEPARRHLRARGLPRLRPGRAALALERQVGLAPGRARDRDRVRPARRARPLPRRAPLRRGAARSRARLRLAGVPVLRLRDERELERRDHARLPRLGLLALHVLVLAWRRRGPLRLVEVRGAPARAALAHVPERLRLRPASASPPASCSRRSRCSRFSCSSRA